MPSLKSSRGLVLFVASDEATSRPAPSSSADGGALLGPVPDAKLTRSKDEGQEHTGQHPNELTIENSVLVLIDHQPWIGLLFTRSIQA